MQHGGPKQGPGQPFGNRNVSGRGPHNQFQGHGQNPAAVRPPIHLGNGGPPPVAFNAGPAAGGAGTGGGVGMGMGMGMVRPGAGAGAGPGPGPGPAGGMAAPMRGHLARGRGAPNAPRGPAHMRRNANPNGNDVSSSSAAFSASSSAGNVPGGFNQGGGGGGGGGFKGNKGFDKAQTKKRNQGGKEKDNKEVKPTMTDFRIVGVKFGSGQNVWEWGIVDGKVPDVVGVAVGVGESETENQLQLQAQTHDGLVKVEEEEAEPASALTPASQANQSPEKKVTIKQEPDVEGESVAVPSGTGTGIGNETLPAEAEDVEEKDRVKDEEKEVKDEKEKKKRGEKRKAKSPDAGVFYPPFPKIPVWFPMVLVLTL